MAVTRVPRRNAEVSVLPTYERGKRVSIRLVHVYALLPAGYRIRRLLERKLYLLCWVQETSIIFLLLHKARKQNFWQFLLILQILNNEVLNNVEWSEKRKRQKCWFCAFWSSKKVILVSWTRWKRYIGNYRCWNGVSWSTMLPCGHWFHAPSLNCNKGNGVQGSVNVM